MAFDLLRYVSVTLQSKSYRYGKYLRHVRFRLEINKPYNRNSPFLKLIFAKRNFVCKKKS